jgi:LL-diaminopimelate aminotransferase
MSPYFFVDLARKVAERRARGQPVISFAEGDPDLPMPESALARLLDTARDPLSHRYPDPDGIAEFRRAAADWYLHRFGVHLDPDREILPLIGTKEGIAHTPLALIDPGDISLIPDPGYPAYSIGTLLAGGQCYNMPLSEARGWLPDLEAIPSHILRRAKILWLNYPNNPTGAVAPAEFFNRVAEFASAHGILVLHDAAYTDISFDDYKPASFLQTAGGREVGLEFYSLSKTFNMAGWRVGVAVGRADLLQPLLVIKSHLDSGIPHAIQCAASEALRCDDSFIATRNNIYRARRDRLVHHLGELGLNVKRPLAGLYLWVQTPGGASSRDFADRLLDEAGVVVVPGDYYGSNGRGYVRFSLTLPDDQLEAGIEQLKQWQRRVRREGSEDALRLA